MNAAQGAAYVNAQAACALIEAMGMIAANKATPPDQPPPFGKEHFDALIEKYGIHHNAIHHFLFEVQP